MLKSIRPDYYRQRITHIPLSYFKKEGIKGLIIDLDNTLAPWDADHMETEFSDWMAAVKAAGIQAVLVSNNKKARVAAFSRALSIPYIASAAKPLKKSFTAAQKILDLETKEIAVIGDQLFTDVLGGRAAGLHTILVEAMASKEFIGTKFLRMLEKFAKKKLALEEGQDEE